MRLQDYSNGRVYASDGRTVFAGASPASLERLGRIPVSRSGFDALAVGATTARPWKPLLERVVGRFPTATVRAVTADRLIATVGRDLFASADGGRSWDRRLTLPPSSGRMGVLPSAIAVDRGTVYVGEYPLARDASPRLLRSPDGGRTWNALRTFSDVRHLHGVQVDPFDDALWLTTGDADAACRIYRYFPAADALELVGGGSQDWRAVELALTPEAVLWGVDCAYADRNPVYRLPRERLARDDPDPDVVHELRDSVYYAATLAADDDRFAVFATAAEAGGDRTAPDSTDSGTATDRAVVTASSAASGYTDWHRLATYRRGRCLTDAWNPGGRLPIANAYVFLAAVPETGLLVNPYNTRRHDGEIRTIPLSRFRTTARDEPSAVPHR